MQTEGHKMSELDNYMESDKFTHREKIALEYCDAIMDNPLYADDELWALLHEEFTEPELVELGYYVVQSAIEPSRTMFWLTANCPSS